MALELAKINLVCSVTWIFFNGSSSNFVTYCLHNLLAKSNNQPDPMKQYRVIALELSKIAQINLVRSVTGIFFNESSSNLVYQT